MQELEKLLSCAAAAGEAAPPPGNGVMPVVRAVLEEFKRLEHSPQAATAAGVAGGGGGEARVSPLEAGQLLEVVRRACGQAARELLLHLRNLLAALDTGGVTVRASAGQLLAFSVPSPPRAALGRCHTVQSVVKGAVSSDEGAEYRDASKVALVSVGARPTGARNVFAAQIWRLRKYFSL